MTHDSSTTNADIALRSPEMIIRERIQFEEAYDEALKEAAHRERMVRDAKSNLEYKQLRVEIAAEIDKIPERLHRSSYQNGELVDVLSRVIVHRRRRFLLKTEEYITVETEQKALWHLSTPYGQLWISADGTLFKRKYIEDDRNPDHNRLDERYEYVSALIPVLFDDLFPFEKPKNDQVVYYRRLLEDLRGLGIQAP